jgi:hypothetical protein
MERSVEIVADGTVRLPLWKPCTEDKRISIEQSPDVEAKSSFVCKVRA